MPIRAAWGGSSSAACPLAAGCLLLALLLLQQPSAVEPAKRLDCRAFCRLTGFRFNAGLCKCGYMLFASKRSQQPTLYDIRKTIAVLMTAFYSWLPAGTLLDVSSRQAPVAKIGSAVTAVFLTPALGAEFEVFLSPLLLVRYGTPAPMASDEFRF
ncbi:hypothetical protein HPB51_010811 [Rhipicephalus microplus]|uniref:Secreted protein n=1 Tax=Rhipicephalus microplus TaxID=6941 RepID=A0A9J6DM29_RHIMP|nr:hypothetical protein HPB51_010811 [Rhipicephalus microplus]